MAVGFGLFMGIVPLWGYQMIAAFALAHVLRLNKAIVLIASNISLPPMIPFILYASVKTGALVLHQPMALTFHDITFESVKGTLTQYLLGSFVFAAFAGMLGGLLTFAFLKLFKKQ